MANAVARPLKHPVGEAGMFSHLLANFEGLVYRCLSDSNWTMQFISECCLALTGDEAEDLIANSRVCYEDLIHLKQSGALCEQGV